MLGKLIRQSLKTNGMSVAESRLADREKEEREKAAGDLAVESGDMTFADALSFLQLFAFVARVRARLLPPTMTTVLDSHEENRQEEATGARSWPG